MRRSFLIAGGTVGGLGAVLAVTPPQFTSSLTEMALPAAPATASSTPTATAAPATPSATPSATAKKKSSTKNATTKTTPSTPAATATPTATPSATAAPTQSAGVTGTFTGNPVSMQYGIVQVKITVSNGKITDAQAIQAPSGRNDRWTQMSVPVLRQRTLAAQSAKIQGVSGASYTSYGWYTSLVSALSKAGL